MVSEKAYANPKILTWARKKRGFTLQQAANTIKIDKKRMENVESGRDHITMIQLRKIANTYKRPVASFYLPNVPIDFDTPDFRGHGIGITGKLDIQIRQILEYKEDAKEFYSLLNKKYNYQYIGSCKITDPIEKISERIITTLKFEQEKIRKLKNDIALNYWKKIVEGIGILVFQFGEILPEETRGFSLSDTPYPVIALNQKDTPYARIFTIIHEITHIFLNEPGICHSQEQTGNNRIEILCNNVAAEILLPKKEIIQRYGNKIDNISDMDKLLNSISDEFKVSYSVINFRFYNLGLISEKFKEVIFEDIKEKRKRRTKKGGDNYNLRESRMGKEFLSLIFEALDNKLISESLVYDITNLTKNGLEHFQNKWESGSFK